MTESNTPTPPTPAALASRRGARGRIPLPPAVLARRGGRVLDPSKAGTFRDRPLLPTAYVADQLLVQGGSTSAMEALVDAARATKHAIGTRSEEPDAYVERLGDAALGALASSMWVRRMRLAPDRDKGTPADAWEVLRRYRENVGNTAQDYTVGLNHLVHLTAPSGGITGNPLFDGPALEGSPLFDGPAYFEGNPLFDGPSESSGALRGRAPLAFLGHPPAPAPGEARTRRPVVAVLDTGLGEHPWLTEPWVTLGASVNGQRIGLGPDGPDPELTGVVNDPLGGGLDKDSGHGTFIAGIVRQVCPDAKVLAIRVMPSDGVVDEHQLTIALNQLLVRQAQGQLLGRPDEIVDVMSLSLGYYHESPEDVLYTSALARTLEQLGRLGVCVVASAGNDSTTNPMFPAGLAPAGGHGARRGAVPLVSVGALNPNGTVALFSNDGDWVSCRRPGAAVISTFPT
ncbi:MAG: S8/S53 family peptidase, partial [Lapillicoccus sp.]